MGGDGARRIGRICMPRPQGVRHGQLPERISRAVGGAVGGAGTGAGTGADTGAGAMCRSQTLRFGRGMHSLRQWQDAVVG